MPLFNAGIAPRLSAPAPLLLGHVDNKQRDGDRYDDRQCGSPARTTGAGRAVERQCRRNQHRNLLQPVWRYATPNQAAWRAAPANLRGPAWRYGARTPWAGTVSTTRSSKPASPVTRCALPPGPFRETIRAASFPLAIPSPLVTGRQMAIGPDFSCGSKVSLEDTCHECLESGV
jgi:hypothetical protein